MSPTAAPSSPAPFDPAAPGHGARRPLTRADLPVDTVALARFLLGTILVRELPEGVVAGRVVETEAYPPGDPAMHAYRGMTARNRSLFASPGTAYVYRCYGVSWMLNVAAEPEGIGAGVLFRALEPLEGAALMALGRGHVRVADLARGPGRLAAALGLDRRQDGLDLCGPGPLRLETDDAAKVDIGVSTRIGLTKAADAPLRFYVRGSRFLSGPGRLNR